MFRYALHALRNSAAPMTVREITDAVMAAKRIANATVKQRARLEAGLRSCLERNVGKTMQQAGEGVPKRWVIR